MKDQTQQARDFRTPHRVPLEYWETCDARQGGVIGEIDERGLLIRSHVNMSIGGELRIKVFFSTEIKFDEFQASVKIIGKDLCCVEGWEAYEYELEFVSISEEDRLELRRLLNIRQMREIRS